MGSEGTSSVSSGAASFCDIAKPIVWYTADDPRTIEAVKEHNAVGVKLCGWQGHSK